MFTFQTCHGWLRQRIRHLAETVQDRLSALFPALTRAEKQLAGVITENYPVSGMGSITRLAEAAGVSTPTVARMVQKLGYSGFPEFQAALRVELEARMSNPIEKHEAWSRHAPESHMLNRFADAVLRQHPPDPRAGEPRRVRRGDRAARRYGARGFRHRRAGDPRAIGVPRVCTCR